VHNQDGGVHSEFTNVDGDDVELVLKGSGFVGLVLDGREDLAFAGHVSDDAAEEPSLAGLDLGAREEHWGWDVVVAFGVLGVGLVISLSLLALWHGLLVQVIGLTSHGGFIAQNTGCLKDDTVDWDVHTIFDFDFITDFDVVFVDNTFLRVSKYGNSFGGFSKGLLLQELLLLTVVRPGSNQGYNGDSNKNTETLDPSVSEIVGVGKRHINDNLNDGADDQKLKHEIVESLPKQDTESSPRWWRLEVGTESFFTSLQTVG